MTSETSPSSPHLPALTRRHLLGLGAAAGVAVTTPSAAHAASSGPTAAVGERAISMAMHVHTAFSEGTASMLAHLEQATATGVDVIWWTDHDFRLQAHGYRQAVRFEGLSEPENGLSWTWTPSTVGPVAGAVAAFVAEPHSPDEDGKAMRVTATGPGDGWGLARWEGTPFNSTYTTSLAATVLELDVLAETLGDDAELVVEVTSSYRPATGGRPAGRYGLEYRVGAREGRWTEAGGLLGVVGTAAGSAWTRLTMDLESDVATFWPDLLSADSGLHRLRVSVRARRGATASAVVDRLRFNRSRREGDESLAIQQELMDAYAPLFPAVRQHQGSELSLVRHVNAFGAGLRLPDYGDAPPRKVTTIPAAQAMVEFVHDSGCLAQFNHPLEEAPTGPKLARVLIETNALEADTVEVGSKEDFTLSVYGYDAAARNAVFTTATGTSDDHTGQDWLGQTQRWVTSVWATSTDEADLFAALRAGRAWFWDPQLWPGTLEITGRGGVRMGGVRVDAATSVPIEVSATTPPAGGRLDAVVGVVDHAGVGDPTPMVTRTTLRHRAGRPTPLTVDTSRAAGAFLRIEVLDAAGAVVGFSNPVWLLTAEPPNGVPAQRRV